MRGYEAAGAQAIQIEDQEFPKKCGHTPGRRVVPIADAARSIKVAVEARASKDFLIIARTDARTAQGLDEALRRGEAFVKAGADILFIESPESEAEMEKIGRSFAACRCGQYGGGRAHADPVPRGAGSLRVQDRDFSGRRFPRRRRRAAIGLRRDPVDGLQQGWSGELYPFEEFSRLMGFERVWAFERDHMKVSFREGKLVLPDRIELSTSPLPMECSTTELRQHARYSGNRPKWPPTRRPVLATRTPLAQARGQAGKGPKSSKIGACCRQAPSKRSTQDSKETPKADPVPNHPWPTSEAPNHDLALPCGGSAGHCGEGRRNPLCSDGSVAGGVVPGLIKAYSTD